MKRNNRSISTYTHTTAADTLEGVPVTLATYTQRDRHIYGSSRLGMDTHSVELIASFFVSPSADGTIHTTNADDRMYELTNHLGNVLATFTARKLPLAANGVFTGFSPHATSLTDYYPFGSGMAGRTVTGGYRYGFNAMEREDDLYAPGNAYDFGARMYDGRLGRWWSVDPKANQFLYLSCYSSFGNRPIYFVDEEGEVIRVAGNLVVATKDIQSVVPEAYKSLIRIVDNQVLFDISEEAAIESMDPGVLAIYRLANSDKTYLYDVPEEGVKVMGLSKLGDRWSEKAVLNDDRTSKKIKQFKGYTKRGREKWKKGVLTETRIGQAVPDDPNVDFERRIPVDYQKETMTRTEVVFHEFLELYFEGEVGLPYSTHPDLSKGSEFTGSGAHNSAINVSEGLPSGDVRKGNMNGSARIPDEPQGDQRRTVK
jgi:RHS repeat-associated protein